MAHMGFIKPAAAPGIYKDKIDFTREYDPHDVPSSAEQYWKNMPMSSAYAYCKLQEVFNKYTTLSLNDPIDGIIERVLKWPDSAQKRLYVLLYNAGHRINR